jgi:septum formation protein
MLTELQGRTHVVITGIAIRHPKGLIVLADENQVTFAPLTREEIEAYVATGDSLDKAGAYGIQGMAGGFLQRLEGSIESVMGLPVLALAEALKDAH